MDFDREILSAAGDPQKIHKIVQAKLRHKFKAKLGITLECHDFEFPDSLAGEQSTGDELAHVHASLISPGEDVLDLTCGLGIDTFHMARVARSVTACELKPHVAEAARRNAVALGLDNVKIVNTDSVEWLKNSDRRFSTIFLDPARRSNSGGRLYALADCQPDAAAHMPLLRSRADRVIVKCSPMLDISRTIADLGGDVDIMVLGSAGECKELVAIVPGAGNITVITSGYPLQSFSQNELTDAGVVYAMSEVGDYLCEPSPAMMKSGGVGWLCRTLGLKKISAYTQLCVAKSHPGDFPGKVFEVVDVVPFDKRGIRSMSASAASGAEIAVRNMGGITTEELRRRLKISEGTDFRIYGVRDYSGKRFLILTRKINA